MYVAGINSMGGLDDKNAEINIVDIDPSKWLLKIFSPAASSLWGSAVRDGGSVRDKQALFFRITAQHHCPEGRVWARFCPICPRQFTCDMPDILEERHIRII